ncbi:CD177 antigen-like isoform X2 [Rousettus aegyptiacus]|uniref:CD177 antigen-like isoform X2 n=1 Tax=Rousettus aegyptiacus TaxID=9407 RepID=UPI00168D57B7|nr:CD177 antigen-like isoform X2 [Rousettus aegyptiacus]
MRPALLPALLGIALVLPWVEALICQSGTLESVVDISQLPFQWKAGQRKCEDGWGCLDTMMLIENGPQVYLLLIKNCTNKEDQEVQVTQHRAGPGLSIISYTQVCRRMDFCNDLSTSIPFGAPRPTPVPGSVRCPVCLSKEGCDSEEELTCPAGHTHCYKGVLQFRGVGMDTNLTVQGCKTEVGCNLLNKTKEIGPLSLTENCGDAFRTCQQSTFFETQPYLAVNPIQWNRSKNVTCDLNEVCQETLLLIDVGPKSLIVGSKTCSKAKTQDSMNISIHSEPPGVFIASYAHFCSSDGCNNASSTRVLLDSLPRPEATPQGNLLCPVCVEVNGSCTHTSENVICPKGNTHCYRGSLRLSGGALSATIGIRGCMAQTFLMNYSEQIGELLVFENEDKTLSKAGASPSLTLAWVVGLGLSSALWYGAPLLLTPFPHDS